MDIASTLAMHPEMTARPVAASDDADLVSASLNGDDEAFAGLIRLHQRRVFRLAGRFFRQRADIEDVAQETFLSAWSKLNTYRAKAPFEHWLTRVCLNCCYERLRKKKRAEQSLDDQTDPEAPQTDPTAALEVRRLLEILPPADRFVLLMLDGEGWSVAEIAERLGWSLVNVKVRAHRARKRLRRLLEQEPCER